MGAGGIPSGGIVIVNGRRGDLPTKTSHINSRYDLYVNGVRVQSRWFDSKGSVVRNRDFIHQDAHHNHIFPHDHRWVIVNGEPSRIPTNLEPDYEHYDSKEEIQHGKEI